MHRRADIRTYAVILVGGRGKRLRPLSTDRCPKAFLSVTADRKTMFRNTLDRIAGMVPPGRIVVVANRKHVRLVRKDLPKIAHKNIILEPSSRNTAPAIAIAARFLMNRDRDAIMLVMPTDQYAPDADEQIASLKKGIDFVSKNEGVIVVIGLKPDRAATEYGYIKVPGSGTVVKVERFTEKPGIRSAVKYLAGGRHLWNAGIFIFRASTLMASLKKNAPGIFRLLKGANIDKSYEEMPDISIDYAIMERADNIYCVKSSYEWDDLGSFTALEKVLNRESRRFVKRDGKIVKIL